MMTSLRTGSQKRKKSRRGSTTTTSNLIIKNKRKKGTRRVHPTRFVMTIAAATAVAAIQREERHELLVGHAGRSLRLSTHRMFAAPILKMHCELFIDDPRNEIIPQGRIRSNNTTLVATAAIQFTEKEFQRVGKNKKKLKSNQQTTKPSTQLRYEDTTKVRIDNHECPQEFKHEVNQLKPSAKELKRSPEQSSLAIRERALSQCSGYWKVIGNQDRYVTSRSNGNQRIRRTKHFVDCRLQPYEEYTDDRWSSSYQTQHHCSITSALVTSIPGDVIMLKPGSYEEDITISIPVIIRSEQSKSNQRAVIFGSVTITDSSENCILDGLQFSCDAVVSQPLLSVSSCGLIVKNCSFSSLNNNCLLVSNDSTPHFKNCSFSATGHEASIRLFSRSKPTIEECTIKDSGGIGILVEGFGTKPLITKCTIENGRGTGIVFSKKSSGDLSECSITKNGCLGILVESGSTPRIDNNMICENEGGGVRIHGISTRPVLSKNTLKENGDRCVFVTDGSKPFISRNIFKNSPFGVVFARKSTGLLEKNKFISLQSHACVARESSCPVAVGNVFFINTPGSGFALLCSDSVPKFIKNTFIGNTARVLTVDRSSLQPVLCNNNYKSIAAECDSDGCEDFSQSEVSSITSSFDLGI